MDRPEEERRERHSQSVTGRVGHGLEPRQNPADHCLRRPQPVFDGTSHPGMDGKIADAKRE